MAEVPLAGGGYVAGKAGAGNLELSASGASR